MITKQKLLVVSVLFISIGFFHTASADTATSSPGNSTTTSTSSGVPQILGLQTPPVPAVIAAMKQAKIQLSGITLNHALIPVYKNIKNKKTGKTVKTLVSYNLGDKDIALAILDPASGNIIITIGRQNGKKMVFEDPAVSVQLVIFNGVNSKFQVASPAGGQIVALKYLISAAESGSKAGIEKGLSEALYVPYSPSFAQPDVLAYGANYLDNIINNVANDLKDLPSQAIPGQTVTQAIKPALIKSLVYAEHTDTNKVLNGPNIKDTIDQLNILFAMNEGDAYKYSVSSAGARGIAQFMPATYGSLVSRHAYANLIPDFVAGMSDHENSIKAMYLLLDDYAGTVRVKGAQGFAEGRVFEYGAASYNGGTTRVAKAVNLYRENWNQDGSAQIGSFQSQVNSLSAQVKDLKAKIKKTTDKKIKAALQTELITSTSQLAAAAGDLENLKSGTLRNETVNYLNKIYKVIQYFNGQEA